MRARSVIVIIASLSVGCSALLGVREIYLDENAVPGGEDGSLDGNGTTDGGLPDGTVVLPDGAVTCQTDLQTDNKNCGRCGRDCLGAACTKGMCEPIVLAAQLTNPTGLWLTTPSVFVTAGPASTGKVLEVSKNPGQAVKTLVGTGHSWPWGLFVDGTTLYFADRDYPNNGTDRHGGIWRCTLPACAAPTLVVAANWPKNPILVDGVIYFAESNNSQVVRVLPNGTQAFAVSSGTLPTAVAADKTHVYYTGAMPSLWRAFLDGGSELEVGPQGCACVPPGAYYVPGDIKVDGDRFFYTYSDGIAADAGHAISISKTNLAAPKIEYGAGNTIPYGVALDATYVYWTNWGTETGNLSNADGDVRACPKTGCPPSGPIILATGLARPDQIAVDDSGVYFTLRTNPNQPSGSVQKVAKP